MKTGRENDHRVAPPQSTHSAMKSYNPYQYCIDTVSHLFLHEIPEDGGGGTVPIKMNSACMSGRQEFNCASSELVKSTQSFFLHSLWPERFNINHHNLQRFYHFGRISLCRRALYGWGLTNSTITLTYWISNFEIIAKEMTNVFDLLLPCFIAKCSL